MKHHSWRKALAVPAVVSLAFGGALLAAGPALADPAVSTPSTTVTPTPTDTSTAAPTDASTAAPTDTSTSAPTATTTVTPAPAVVPAPSATSTPAPAATSTPAPAATSTPVPTATSTPTPTPTATTPTTKTPAVDTTPSQATTFAVTTPVEDVAVASTTPVFTGTGVAGSTVVIEYIGADQDVHSAGTATVDTTGAWTITTSFPALGPGITKAVLTVADVDANGDPLQNATPVIRLLSFLTPPVQATGQSIVLTPNYPTEDGTNESGIGLATTGFTAGEPLTITLTGPNGKPVVFEGSSGTPVVADANGAFSELLALPADPAGGTYVVTVTGATSQLVLTKSAYLLGDPTITSPTAGQKIIGTKVTFTGTGTPGSSIGLVIALTSELKAAEAAASSSSSSSSTDSTTKATTPGAAASDPTDGSSENIVVGASGTWSVTVTLPKTGDYTAVAIAGLLDSNGDPISDNTGLAVLSGPSDDVEFVLAAPLPPVVTTSATGPTLAFTGSNAGPYVISGGLAVVLGLGLMVASRRRRRDETAE